MPKKRKTPTASQDAQQGIQSIMEVMERLQQEPRPNLHGMASRLGVGVDHLTDALDRKGIKCLCFLKWGTVKYPRRGYWDCTCRPKRKGERSLSGTHCRDSEGNFVPVSQCTGPVGRDPKTGRFISLLRAEMK